MPPKKKPKAAAKKNAPKKAPAPKFVFCESTGQKVFIARATLADLKLKSTYTTQKKRLWTLTNCEKRHECYQQAAMCICHLEQDLLPSVGGRSWEVSASITEPNNMVLFRTYQGQMELAVLPHLLEKIPQPPVWAGKRRHDTAEEYQDNRDDDIVKLQGREISWLSTVAWDLLRNEYPIPILALKWKSPDRITFTSRKAAWEHAAILAKREVWMQKHLLGIGAHNKLLQPSKPSILTTLQVGKLRFERDGLWVVGQELAWQEGRGEELEALAAEPVQAPTGRKWSASSLFIFETRDTYRNSKDEQPKMTYRQAETELRQVWKTTIRDEEKKEWSFKARQLNGEEIKEEARASEVEEDATSTTEEPNTEEAKNEQEANDGDQKTVSLSSSTTCLSRRPWTALTYYVHCERHAYREERKTQDGSFTLKDADTELREIFKTLPKDEKKKWKDQVNVVRQGATPQQEAKPSKVEGLVSSVGPLEQGAGESLLLLQEKNESNVEKRDSIAPAIVHPHNTRRSKVAQRDMQPTKASTPLTLSSDAYDPPRNRPSCLVDEVVEIPCPSATLPDDRSDTPDIMVEEEKKEDEMVVSFATAEQTKQEETTTPPTASFATDKQPKTKQEEATNHSAVSSTPEPEVPVPPAHNDDNKQEETTLPPTVRSTPESQARSSLPQEDSLPPQVGSTAKEPVPETTKSSQARGLSKKSRKKDLTSYTNKQRWCLDPDQMSLCYEAIMDHFDKVMLTVKSRDLMRELQDGFDLLRERGRGRFDMELPSFDSEVFSFLTDLERAPWMPIVKTILGEDAVLIHKGSFMSLPGAEAQDYHQDGVHLTTHTQRPCHAINVFVPLVDLASRNGPTEFCLGSHILGHENYDRDFVETPKVKAGTPIIFDYRLGHRGLGNSSQACRPIVYCTYARAAGGKEFQDSVNFSRRRYHRLGEFVEKPLSRAERSKKRKRSLKEREEEEMQKAIELSEKEHTPEPTAGVQDDKMSANNAARDGKAHAVTEQTPPEPVK